MQHNSFINVSVLCAYENNLSFSIIHYFSTHILLNLLIFVKFHQIIATCREIIIVPKQLKLSTVTMLQFLSHLLNECR